MHANFILSAICDDYILPIIVPMDAQVCVALVGREEQVKLHHANEAKAVYVA